MVNYKPSNNYVGVTGFQRLKATHEKLVILENGFASLGGTTSLHNTKNGNDYTVTADRSLKILGLLVHHNATTGQPACRLQEGTILDTAGTDKFLWNSPGAGQWEFPLGNIKINSGKYVTVVSQSYLFSCIVVGIETA